MKKSIYLAFSLFTIFSLIAVAPSAFAAHGEGGMSATVENAAGSSTPGCEPDCFIPSTVVITVGGTVTWENTDTAAHTSSSGTPADGPDGVFDSSLIMAGGSYSHTFDTAGTYVYFCMVHPWMEGTVIVEAEASTPLVSLNSSIDWSTKLYRTKEPFVATLNPNMAIFDWT